MKQLRFEVTKFTLVGAFSFGLTFLIFAAFLNILHTHYLFALAAAWVGGVLFTYTANVLWVFNINGARRSWLSFLRYTFSSGMSVTINAGVLAYLVERLGVDPFIAQMLLVPFIIVFNFLATKYWSLRGARGADSVQL